MCGIFGSIGFAPDRNRIEIVRHRGPDGDGWREFRSPAGAVALGHRRLSIIDLSDAGLQPMADVLDRYHLVFNGEIYNYLELRAELEAKGEVFRTATDSEVLLRAYQVWGEGALDRLRGMFSFLIWDDRAKRLLAARDRFGIKPLYVTSRGGVAFASEIKQLLGIDGANVRINAPRTADFLVSGMADHTDETMFDGIMQIRGGECALVDAAGDKPVMTVRRWYSGARTEAQESELDAPTRFRKLLSDAVSIHLRSDVKVGSCLSGGLDSSSIVCLASDMLARGGAKPMETVSACFPGESIDETHFVKIVAERAAVIPHFVTPRAEDVFSHVAAITWHQDEPFGSTSVFAQWCVFAQARRAGLKVMLDGQGADEELAGYHWCFALDLAAQIRAGDMLGATKAIAERRHVYALPVTSQLSRAAIHLLPQAAGQWIRRRREIYWRHDWLDGEAGRQYSPDGLQVAAGALGVPYPRTINALCDVMMRASNLPLLLHWEDRNSMAHSIEARLPFIDHPLVEFALNLAQRHKLSGATTKRVLRQAMRGIIPDAIADRHDKIGFATPEATWFRGSLRPLIEDGVAKAIARFPGLLNPSGANALARDYLDGRAVMDFALWRIVNLGIWGERFSLSA